MSEIKHFALISLIIACYYFTFYIYWGLITPLQPGDSFDYHIPISKSILDGSFLNPEYEQVKQYFPGSSEAINSIFIALNIPLTLSNIFAIFILTICCYKLGTTFRLNRYYALLFALTIFTSNAIIRWMNAVSIDIWIAVYFIAIIILLEKPKKSFSYFLKLGFFTGMIIGSKYNAFYYILILFMVYVKNLYYCVNWRRFIIFLIPVTIFGLFWYIRNYIAAQNPFYPISMFGFPGISNFGGYLNTENAFWRMSLIYPSDIFNAAFGEFKLWIFSIFIVIAELIRKYFINKEYRYDQNIRIYIIGTLAFILFLTYPTEKHTWIMVSSFRYSFPAFITLILGVFIIAAKYKKERIVCLISLGSMLNVISMAYFPKLLLIYLPLALLIFYAFENKIKLIPVFKKRVYEYRNRKLSITKIRKRF